MTPDTPESYGLAAIGKAGQFTLEILETRAGNRLMSIETDIWSLSFTLSELGLAGMLAHLRGRDTPSELKIGEFLDAPVTLIRDDEFSDRFFLQISKPDHVLHFVLGGDRLAQFTSAVADTLDDLAN